MLQENSGVVVGVIFINGFLNRSLVELANRNILHLTSRATPTFLNLAALIWRTRRAASHQRESSAPTPRRGRRTAGAACGVRIRGFVVGKQTAKDHPGG